jgi:multidrug resistance efflux pump
MKRATKIKLIVYPLSVLALLALATGVMALIPMTEYVAGEGYVTTDDNAQIRPREEGPIKEILCSYGEEVEQGQVLFVLEDDTQQAALKKSRAALQQCQAELQKAEAVLATARAELGEAQKKLDALQARQTRDEQNRKARELTLTEQLRRAENELRRLEKLGATGTVSEQRLEDVRAKVAISRAGLDEVRSMRSPDLDRRDREVAQSQIAVAESRVNRCKAELDECRATIEQARADVDQRKADLERRRIRSPLNGTVLKNSFVVGEVVEKKQVLGEVFDDSEWVVKATFREGDVRKLVSRDSTENKTALIELAAYPESQFGYIHGRIKYTPKVVTPQRTGDGVVLLYFKLERFDRGDAKTWRERFIPGQAALVDVEVGPTNLLYWLLGIDSR